jgi:hypothetical protein
MSKLVVFSIGFCLLSSSDLMQGFGSLPIRARTTRFPEKPKKSFVDGIGDSVFFPHPPKFSVRGIQNNNKSQFIHRKSTYPKNPFCLFFKHLHVFVIFPPPPNQEKIRDFQT